jgi:aminoglycoside phosphotransferase (APT) family kinase protein
VSLPTADALCRRLLGRTPDRIEPLVIWDHKATYRCVIGDDAFVCKVDVQLEEILREIDGLERAAAAGIAVPEVVAADTGAFAMRWVAGTALTYSSPAEWWRAAGREVRRVHAVVPPPYSGGGFAPARDSWEAVIEAEVEEELEKCVRENGLDQEAVPRVRRAVADGHDELAAAPASWYHGDLQPDHVIVDPESGEIAAIIDWSDQGRGDGAWDIAVLTLDDESRLDAFLAGYDAEPDERDRLARMLPLYRLVRWLGEIRWLTEHGMTDAAAAAQRSLTENCPPRATSGQ